MVRCASFAYKKEFSISSQSNTVSIFYCGQKECAEVVITPKNITGYKVELSCYNINEIACRVGIASNTVNASCQTTLYNVNIDL